MSDLNVGKKTVDLNGRVFFCIFVPAAKFEFKAVRLEDAHAKAIYSLREYNDIKYEGKIVLLPGVNQFEASDCKLYLYSDKYGRLHTSFQAQINKRWGSELVDGSDKLRLKFKFYDKAGALAEEIDYLSITLSCINNYLACDIPLTTDISIYLDKVVIETMDMQSCNRCK